MFLANFFTAGTHKMKIKQEELLLARPFILRTSVTAAVVSETEARLLLDSASSDFLFLLAACFFELMWTLLSCYKKGRKEH